MDEAQHDTSEPPTPTPAAQESLQVRVKDAHGLELIIRIKTSTKMERVMRAYCGRSGRDIKTVRFRYDGERVEDEHTPETLQMEDGDLIDVFEEQVGGGM